LEHFKKLQGNLEFHQDRYHPGDVPDTRSSVQRPLTNGPRGWPAGQRGFMSVWPATSCTRVYTRRRRPKQWRKSVEAEPHGRLATTWRVTDLTKSVTPPWTLINTPLPVKIRTHTPYFGDFICKASILSVVAKRSLVGRVVKL
jgi:hypothetical protein